tara:strand:+ start:670 stop:945 length:276 start_codon:yes stop_codon:yes gene_type:complete
MIEELRDYLDKNFLKFKPECYFNGTMPDTFRYMNGSQETLHPGMFLYHGLSMGYLHTDQGPVWCTSSQARDICQIMGLQYDYRDTFKNYFR